MSLLAVAAAVPTGVAWWLLAPLPRLQVAASGVLVAGGDSEAFIAADAWFAICTATAGVVCAFLAFIAWRGVSPAVLAGLAVGGSLGALAAWRIGAFLGPPPVDVQAQARSVGALFDGPLELSALGVLVAWPLASVIVYFSLVAGLDSSR